VKSRSRGLMIPESTGIVQFSPWKEFLTRHLFVPREKKRNEAAPTCPTYSSATSSLSALQIAAAKLAPGELGGTNTPLAGGSNTENEHIFTLNLILRCAMQKFQDPGKGSFKIFDGFAGTLDLNDPSNGERNRPQDDDMLGMG